MFVNAIFNKLTWTHCESDQKNIRIVLPIKFELITVDKMPRSSLYLRLSSHILSSNQMSAAEVVTDMKAFGLVDSSPLTSISTSTESTAKPPPFKDPSFMVSECHFRRSPAVWFCGLMLTMFMFPLYLGSTPGSAERQQAKRTEPGRISNKLRFWNGLYPGGSMTQTVNESLLFNRYTCGLFMELFLHIVVLIGL